jgi:branched-subunit amino acid transport protein
MVIASISINLLGIFVFLFIFWKRLREDYSSEIIFKTAFEILIGILVGFLLSLKFVPAGFFWLAALGALIGLVLAVLSLKVKFYETFEALIISSFPWISFVFLLDSITHSSLRSFFAFIAILVFVFISYYLDAHYKNFTWYKSGKIGFAGIVTVALFFITRALLAIFGISMVSFVSLRFEALISGSAAFICFILLYNLAKIKE